jgi:hypothetical protein
VATCESASKHSTIQISTQFRFHVMGQASLVVLARVCEKRFQILAHQPVQDRFGRATGNVRGCESSHGRSNTPIFVPCSCDWISREKQPASGDLATFEGDAATAAVDPSRRHVPLRGCLPFRCRKPGREGGRLSNRVRGSVTTEAPKTRYVSAPASAGSSSTDALWAYYSPRGRTESPSIWSSKADSRATSAR